VRSRVESPGLAAGEKAPSRESTLCLHLAMQSHRGRWGSHAPTAQVSEVERLWETWPILQRNFSEIEKFVPGRDL
jgi:hypothetical protein